MPYAATPGCNRPDASTKNKKGERHPVIVSPKKKRRTGRLARRIAAVLLLAYALGALLPCALPPQLSPEAAADTSWMETEASDLNANRARLIATGEEALEIRLALITSAQRSIDLGTYLFAPDESGRKVAAALLAAADRGVRVRLITDGLIGWFNLANDPLGHALGAHPNVEIKFYNPVDLLRPQGLNARYHEKFFLVDDTWLLLGGRNVSDEFLTGEGDPSYNYDQDVLLYRTDHALKDAAAQMRSYFDALWTSSLCALRYDDPAALEQAAVRQCREELNALWDALATDFSLELPDPYAAMVPVEKTLLLTNPTAAEPSAPVAWNRLCQLMETAEERLWMVTPYLVMDGPMRDRLAAVCAAGPGDTRILVNSRESGNNIIASADYTIHRPMAQRLGAALWEFQGAWSMHTKSVLVDDTLSVFGSFNFDPRSVYLDTELMLAVYSPELNAQLAEHMESLWQQSLRRDGGAYEEGSAVPQTASFWKMALITALSPLVSLVRFLV